MHRVSNLRPEIQDLRPGIRNEHVYICIYMHTCIHIYIHICMQHARHILLLRQLLTYTFISKKIKIYPHIFLYNFVCINGYTISLNTSTQGTSSCPDIFSNIYLYKYTNIYIKKCMYYTIFLSCKTRGISSCSNNRCPKSTPVEKRAKQPLRYVFCASRARTYTYEESTRMLSTDVFFSKVCY